MILQLLLLLILLPDASSFVPKYNYKRNQNVQLYDNKVGSLVSIIRDPGLSVGAGLAGLFILVVNRFIAIDTLEVSDLQSRADLLSTIACSSLLLNVLSESDIVARDRDPVALFGYALKEPKVLTNNEKEKELVRWIIQTILNNTPATSVHVIRNKQFIGRGGVIGNDDDLNSLKLEIENMKILTKALQNNEEIYLPDLQILPGKIEFTYLPINCQSVLILPNGDSGAVVVATNQAKALKLKDLRKIREAVDIFSKT